MLSEPFNIDRGGDILPCVLHRMPRLDIQAARHCQLWDGGGCRLCCVVVEAQRTKLNTLLYIAKHIIV